MTRKTKREFDQIKEEIGKLVALLESNEIQQLRKDSEELKNIKSLLSHVKFKIKHMQIMENQNTGNDSIVVTYELPRIVLDIDENGKPSKDEFFYSTNMLNMISLEDMSKFQDFLYRYQRKIK